MRSFVEKMRGLFSKNSISYDPIPLYDTIVAQARNPILYRAGYEIPNTLDGRFDSLCLHLHLVFRRFGEIEGFEAQIQKILDRFFEDMDQSVREIGVGDMSVGRHVIAMGKAYYGRVVAYEASMHSKKELAEKLRLNVFGIDDADATGAHPQSLNLATYVIEQAANLMNQDPQEIIKGRITFSSPETM